MRPDRERDRKGLPSWTNVAGTKNRSNVADHVSDQRREKRFMMNLNDGKWELPVCVGRYREAFCVVAGKCLPADPACFPSSLLLSSSSPSPLTILLLFHVPLASLFLCHVEGLSLSLSLFDACMMSGDEDSCSSHRMLVLISPVISSRTSRVTLRIFCKHCLSFFLPRTFLKRLQGGEK